MSEVAPVWPDELFSTLDRSGPVPLYFQIATRLEEGIRTGVVPSGARLQNELIISERLGISRPTVRRALQELVDKGLLVRRRGIGTQVVRSELTRSLELTSLFDDMQHAHHHPGTKVLSRDLITPSPAIVEKLGLAEVEPVLHLRRLRTADGAPVAVLENHLPAETAELSVSQLEEHGLYQLLSASGITLKVAHQRIGARGASAEEAALLGLEVGAPVLTMERTTFDSSGRAVEYADHCYRPDNYSIQTKVVAR